MLSQIPRLAWPLIWVDKPLVFLWLSQYVWTVMTSHLSANILWGSHPCHQSQGILDSEGTLWQSAHTHSGKLTPTRTYLPTNTVKRACTHPITHIHNTHTHSQQSHLSTLIHNTLSHTHLHTYSHSHTPIHTHKYTQSENKPQWASQGQTLSYLLLP